MSQMISEYIRKGKSNRNKKGFLVAKKVSDNKVVIGWSLCNTPLDEFCSNRAKDIAIGRIEKGHAPATPPSILPQVREFHARCKKYYKLNAVEIVGVKTNPTIKRPKSEL